MLQVRGALFRLLADLLSPRVVALGSDDLSLFPEEIIAYSERSGAEVHVITRASFDEEAVRARLGERLHVHRELGLNALHRIGRVDLYLRESDCNWWSLKSELDLLAKNAGRFPVVCVRGVGWPYARRDQYADPLAIPAAYRQPYKRGGLAPGMAEPMSEGGFNADALHGLFEGRGKSGVLTAVEDFLAEHDGFAFDSSPAFNGVGVLYRAVDFANNPELSSALNSLTMDGLAATLTEKLEESRMRAELEAQGLSVTAEKTDEQLRTLQNELAAAKLRELELRQSVEIARSARELGKIAKGERREREDGKPAPVTPKVAPSEFSEMDFYKNEGLRMAQLSNVREKRARGESLTMVERELLVDRFVPPFERRPLAKRTPGKGVAFVTVANDKFAPGLEAMLLSMLKIYPDFQSDMHVCHDGTLTPFLRARLLKIYPNLIFVEPDMSWFELTQVTPGNHKRVGKLGYMNIHGLALRGYDRVILFDSDVLVLDDISALWDGDDIRVCYDCGDREYVPRSEYTGEYVINSGIISLPGSECTDANFEEMKRVVRGCVIPVCPILDRFADQKAWNIYLGRRRKTFLPVNYNCNIKYAAKHFNGAFDNVSILHFTGPKPWNHADYIHKSLVSSDPLRPPNFPRPWVEAYRKLVSENRLKQFAKHGETRRKTPVKAETSVRGRKTCVFIGNGPSLNKTDLTLVRNLERFCFNWFVLHPEFDAIAPEHLVLASHQFFGGWNTPNPEFPPNFINELYAKKHRPVIWTAFYFRELFESMGIDRDFEVNYFLFEKPFKQFVDKLGRYDGEINGYLNDSRSGVLTAAAPAAVSMGFQSILLVGCDSNYNQQASGGGNYFYDESKHTSLQTEKGSLTATWTDDGRGQFAYKLLFQYLRSRGVDLFDCTVDGKIATVPKRQLAEFADPPRNTQRPEGWGWNGAGMNGALRTPASVSGADISS